MNPIKMRVRESPVRMSVAGRSVTMAVGDARVLYVGGEQYTGAYTVTPDAENAVVLPTTGKVLAQDVTVKKIPVFEVSNADGTTIYIASEVD